MGAGNNARALADGFAGAVLGGGSFMASKASVGGEVQVTFDGDVLGADAVTINADGTSLAETDTEATAIGGGFGAAGGAAVADVTSDADVEAVVGSSASFNARGVVTIHADSDLDADAFSDVAGGALLFGFSITKPQATVAGRTRAQLDGDVTGASEFIIRATSDNDALARAEVFSGGGISVRVAGTDASVTSSADTDVIVGSTSAINIGTGVVRVEVGSTNTASGIATGSGGGAIDVSVVSPSADLQAGTSASVTGTIGSTTPGTGPDGQPITIGVAGALRVLISVQSDDVTVASVDTSGGGIIAVSPSSATALTSPEVSMTLGGIIVASQDIDAHLLAKTDADGFADSSGGGFISVSDLDAEADVDVDITATINADAFLEAGTTLTIHAEHGGSPPVLADDVIDAVNTGTETFDFGAPGNPAGDPPHGLDTGGHVVYDAPGEFEDGDGNDLPNPNDLGGLDDGRSYLVIVTGPTTLRLGVEFDGAVVDPDFAWLRFDFDHQLETGDMVRYEVATGSGIVGLTNGTLYRVFKVDANTIKLATSAPFDGRNFIPNQDVTDVDGDPDVDRDIVEAGDNTFWLPGHDYVDDQPVTYHAPARATFTTQMADIHLSGNGVVRTIVSGSEIIDHSGNTNTIFISGHGYADNEFVLYQAIGGSALSGLVSGTIYKADFVTVNGIRLLNAATDAVIEINETGTGLHTLVKPSERPIGGLTDGRTYYVDVLDVNRIQLLNRPSTNGGGLVDITDGNRDGTHRLVTEGVALFTDGDPSSVHRLVIDVSGSLVGTHRLIGVGGAGTTLGNSGDDVVDASSTGSSGGAINVSAADSQSASVVSIVLTVNDQAHLRGANVIIKATSQANAKAISS